MNHGPIADPTRCPDCNSLLLPNPDRCGTCGLPLRGPLVERLWEVSVQADRLLQERDRLLAELRRSRAGSGETAPTGATAPPVTPRAESTGVQVQGFLLAVGVLLLAVAALIFTVVAWGRLGIGGRAAILATLTVTTAAASVLTRRRGLGSTAESTAVLTVGLLLLDAYAIRSVGLVGLDRPPADGYWAVALGLIAALALAAWRVHPLVTVRLTAAVFGQLPLLVVLGRFEESVAAGLLFVQGAAAVALALRRWPGAAQAVLGVGGAVTFAYGLAAATVLAYGVPGVAVAEGVGPILALLVGALAASGVAWSATVRPVAMAVATLCALAAAHAPAERVLAHQQATALGAALLLVVALALARVPHSWRRGPIVTVAVVGVLAALDTVEVVGETVAGPGVWLDDGRAWTREATGSAREMLGTAWTGSWYVTLTLVLLALAAAIVIAQWPRATLGAPAAPLALAVAALLTVPIAAEWPYLLAVAFDVAAGSVLAAVGAAQPQPVRNRKSVV